MGNKQTKISYSQCWEDAELMLVALDIKSEDRVVSISSGGCNTLAIAGYMPEKLYSVDINPAQNYILQLKYVAIKYLLYDEYLRFIGINQCKSRKLIFEKIAYRLEPSCKTFWEEHIDWIEQGIIHCGNFEKYLNSFTKYILPLVQSKSTIDALLKTTDRTAQKRLFKNKWNNWRWRLLGKVFLSKTIMQLKGRSRVMFAQSKKKNTGHLYLERIRRFVLEGNVNQNPYLEYILKGNFYQTLPYYIKPEKYLRIRNGENIDIINDDLLSFLKMQPDNSLSKFNLSDVFEPLSEDESEKIFEQIIRTSSNNARLIFWNNLVKRDVPPQYKSYFSREYELENELSSGEKVFFYDKFYIYTINK